MVLVSIDSFMPRLSDVKYASLVLGLRIKLQELTLLADRQLAERLELHGINDPSGRGCLTELDGTGRQRLLGFLLWA